MIDNWKEATEQPDLNGCAKCVEKKPAEKEGAFIRIIGRSDLIYHTPKLYEGLAYSPFVGPLRHFTVKCDKCKANQTAPYWIRQHAIDAWNARNKEDHKHLRIQEVVELAERLDELTKQVAVIKEYLEARM